MPQRYRLRWAVTLTRFLVSLVVSLGLILLIEFLRAGSVRTERVISILVVFGMMCFLFAYYQRRVTVLTLTADGLEVAMPEVVVTFRWSDCSGVATISGRECLTFTTGAVATNVDRAGKHMRRQGLDRRIILRHYFADWRTSPLAQHIPTSA